MENDGQRRNASRLFTRTFPHACMHYFFPLSVFSKLFLSAYESKRTRLVCMDSLRKSIVRVDSWNRSQGLCILILNSSRFDADEMLKMGFQDDVEKIISVCIYVHMHVCMHVCLHMYLHVWYLHTYMYMYTYILYIHACYIYIYIIPQIYVHKHTNTCTYTHTQLSSRPLDCRVSPPVVNLQSYPRSLGAWYVSTPPVHVLSVLMPQSIPEERQTNLWSATVPSWVKVNT